MSTVLQVRLDEELKEQASLVYDQLGLDLSSAVRMFLKKSVAVNGIPFEVRNNTLSEDNIAAISNMRNHSEASGLSDMTLDEINEIISQVRKERKKEG